MKIIRIDQGKAIPLPLRILLIILLCVIIFGFSKWLPESYFLVATILVSPLGPAVWFASKVLIIDNDHKEVFQGIWTMGKRLGKNKPFDCIKDIYTEKVQTPKTHYKLADKKEFVSDHQYNAYIELEDNRTHFLISHPLESTLNEKINTIKKKLNLV